MNTRDLFLFICIGCILLTVAVSGLKVEVKPVGDVFDDAVNFLEFTFTEVGKLPAQDMIFELHPDSKLELEDLDVSNYPFDKGCYIKGDEHAYVATIGSSRNTSLYLTFPHQVISIDHTFVCPVGLRSMTVGLPEHNIFAKVIYTDSDDTRVEIKDVSLNLPAQPAHPVITLHDAQIQSIRTVDGVSLSNDYYAQQLVFSFSTNVVADLKITLDHFAVLLDLEHPSGNTFCTTGSGSSSKIVGRVISYLYTFLGIILKEQTNDIITCTIVISQPYVSSIPKFPLLRLSFGYNPLISAAIGVENIIPNNYAIIDGFGMRCQYPVCDPYFTIAMYIGDELSYLTSSSIVRIEVENIDMSHVRFNSTANALFVDIGDFNSFCFDQNVALTSLTVYAEGNSIYFTDFTFSNKDMVYAIDCEVHFNALATLNVNQEYGIVRAEIDGNPVYDFYGNTLFRFDLVPFLMIDILDTKRISNQDPEQDDIVSFKFHAYQDDQWAHTVNNPVLLITYSSSVPIAYDSIRCSINIPFSSQMQPIELTRLYNGYRYNIPMDQTNHIFDTMFHCELSIHRRYYTSEYIKLEVHDVYNNIITRASSYAYVNIDPNYDYSPPTISYTTHSCTSLSFIPSDAGTNFLSSTLADAVTADYIKAYNSIVQGASLTRGDVFYAPFSIYQLGIVYLSSFFTPYDIPPHEYETITSTIQYLAICAKDSRTVLEDGYHYQIYTSLKPQYPRLVYTKPLSNEQTWTVFEGYSEEKCQWTADLPQNPILPLCLNGAKCRVNGDCNGPHVYCSVNGVCENIGEGLPKFIESSDYYSQPYAGLNSATTSGPMTITMTTIIMVVASIVLSLFMDQPF